jgi:hypothetical protein
MSMPSNSGQGLRTRVVLILGLAMTLFGGAGVVAEAAFASDGPTVTISASGACDGDASATFANLPTEGAEVTLVVDGGVAFSGVRSSGTYAFANILLTKDDKEHTLGATATSTTDGTTLATAEATYGPCVSDNPPTPTPTPTKSTPTPTPTKSTPPPKPHPTPTHKPHPTPPPTTHHPKPHTPPTHTPPAHHNTATPTGSKSSSTMGNTKAATHHSATATSQHTSTTQSTQTTSVAPPAGGTGDDGFTPTGGSTRTGMIAVYALVVMAGLMLAIGSEVVRRRRHGAHE